jgi:hypothetical protein
MYIEVVSPALAVLSLRALAAGRKPHISEGRLCAYLAWTVGGRYFDNLTSEDFSRARALRQRNNRGRKAREVARA